MTTEPLVPSEVDLRDFAYMPLDVLRLRDSDLAAEATDAEFRAAVMLWCASWHQLPSASLPDNDAVLTRLSGFGRDIEGWKSVRDGALRGWVKCDDGRLYHSVVAEKANEAWDQKKRQRARTAAARAARMSQSARPDTTDPVTDLVTEDVTPSKGTERNGTEEDNNNLPSPTISKEEGGDLGFEDFWDLFPKGEFVSKPKASAAYADLTPAERLQAIAAIPALRSRKPTTNPLSPDRYLRDRLFASSPASRPASRLTVEVERISPQGEAWERWWRLTKGKGAPWSNGVWHFDTEWPPTEKVA